MNDSHSTTLFASRFGEDPTRSFTPDAGFYFDPALYEAEQRGIFQRHWMYFCHVSQVATPGDYLTGEIGGQAICVLRGRDGVLHGFFNVCRHRAHQLLQGSGNLKAAIRCPYHSWTYGLDGQLRSAPHCEAVAGFDKDAIRLAPIGIAELSGFVFVNLDVTARPLVEAEPRFASCLEELVPESRRLRHASTKHFIINANWKVVTENFLENYHSFYSGRAHAELSDIIDQSSYEWIIDDKLVIFRGRGGSKLPYPVEGERTMGGRSEGFQIVFLWPNMAFILLPRVNLLIVFLMNPDGPERTSEPLHYFAPGGRIDHDAQAAMDWFNDKLAPEDVLLVENVQKGLHSLSYRNGRLMVDAAAAEAWSEHFLHHFNQLNFAAINTSTTMRQDVLGPKV